MLHAPCSTTNQDNQLERRGNEVSKSPLLGAETVCLSLAALRCLEDSSLEGAEDGVCGLEWMKVDLCCVGGGLLCGMLALSCLPFLSFPFLSFPSLPFPSLPFPEREQQQRKRQRLG
jgi:hypothetical protein